VQAVPSSTPGERLPRSRIGSVGSCIGPPNVALGSRGFSQFLVNPVELEALSAPRQSPPPSPPYRPRGSDLSLLSRALPRASALSLSFPLLSTVLQAQQVVDLGETIVLADSSLESAFEEPASTQLIGADLIRERAYRTLPQALRDLPGVMVQETAQGQGSPFIRGFTGFRNLFLIDGIRLNNSIFRDGPNQYWNTVDPLSIDRLEVIKGPSAILYGSDSIGGTINAHTKNPSTYGSGTNYGGELFYRTSSAERSHIARAELSVTRDASLGLLVGASGKRFGDLEGGRDIGTMPATGYDEWDADLKLESFIDPDTRLVFALQQVKQNDVPRTHRTVFAKSFEGTSIGSDLRRDLDQERRLAYVQLHGENLDGAIDSYSASLSWQGQEESRDRIRGNGNRELQGVEVGTLGFFTHLKSDTAVGRLTYGVDLYHDEVDSFSSQNAFQGPVADQATYDLLGLFVQDQIEVTESFDVTVGGRLNYAAADADSVQDPVSASKIAIEDNWSAVVGSVRFLYRLHRDAVNLFGGVSQGFRAPNLSDLTRFDSQRTNEFEVPSPGLDPEQYLTYELGVRTRGEASATELTFFYTDIEDQIVPFPTGNVNAAGEFEITKDNVGDGYIVGAEFGGTVALGSELSLFGNSTLMNGRIETFPTSAQVKQEEYISRLMPFTSQLGLRWQAPASSLWVELLGIYADDADKLSTRDKADTSRIPPGGTPGYVVLHARGGCRLGEGSALSLSIENLTNEDYRIHGSGQNMPGLNFILSLSTTL